MFLEREAKYFLNNVKYNFVVKFAAKILKIC